MIGIIPPHADYLRRPKIRPYVYSHNSEVDSDSNLERVERIVEPSNGTSTPAVRLAVFREVTAVEIILKKIVDKRSLVR